MGKAGPGYAYLWTIVLVRLYDPSVPFKASPAYHLAFPAGPLVFPQITVLPLACTTSVPSFPYRAMTVLPPGGDADLHGWCRQI